MPSTDVTIGSTVGLHARPASLFVQAATDTGLPVTIAKDGGAPVDARSLLAVMSLGARHGDTVTLAAEGEGAESAVDRLSRMLASDLDAEGASA